MATETNISSNKRIAKNTLFLYARMLLVMVVALFTSRIVLAALGVDDYGIYNVVGGISSSLIFFSSAISTSTQRYLNFELGRNNIVAVNNVFNLNLLLYAGLAIMVLIAGLTFGQWFVENKLVIPQAQRGAAVIVLYATVISLSSVFIFSVFESVLIARENMKLYAYIGIIDVMMKLGIAYLIMILPDRLVAYAWLMVVVQVLPKLMMAVYCIRKYPETKIRYYWNTKLFKEIFGFTGWNIYGSAVWMFNGQGINILLNLFFGPVVNAANGIAQQVNAAVTNFGNNFFTAVRPQLVKRFSAGEIQELLNLIYASSRFGVYLLWILSLPIIVRSSQILHIWLKDVPVYTPLFVQWVLIYSIVNSLNNPVWTAQMATGKIRKTVIIGSNLFLLAFPVSWLLLKYGVSPWVVFPVLCLGRTLFLITTLHFLSKEIMITAKEYFVKVICPCVITIVLSTLISNLSDCLFPYDFKGLILFAMCSLFTTMLIVFSVGITRGERLFVIEKVRSMIHSKLK